MARPRSEHTKFVRIEATIPTHLRDLLDEESKRTGLGLSHLVRLAIWDRYRDRLFDADAAAASLAVRAARAAVAVGEEMGDE